jgi:hypothetical protein
MTFGKRARILLMSWAVCPCSGLDDGIFFSICPFCFYFNTIGPGFHREQNRTETLINSATEGGSAPQCSGAQEWAL